MCSHALTGLQFKPWVLPPLVCPGSQYLPISRQCFVSWKEDCVGRTDLLVGMRCPSSYGAGCGAHWRGSHWHLHVSVRPLLHWATLASPGFCHWQWQPCRSFCVTCKNNRLLWHGEMGVGRQLGPPHSGCQGWCTVWVWAPDTSDIRASSGLLTTLTIRAVWNVTVKQKVVLKNPQTASLQSFCGLLFPCLWQKLNFVNCHFAQC